MFENRKQLETTGKCMSLTVKVIELLEQKCSAVSSNRDFLVFFML